MRKHEALLEDLRAVRGKAELVDGEIVHMPPTGVTPGCASGVVYASLLEYSRRTGVGRAFPDNVGFVVNLPNRTTMSPDAAYDPDIGPGMDFADHAPAFAVEVRSKNDQGQNADMEIARKRADYFAAGTRVVWDVDLMSPDVISVYRATDPASATTYGRGELAEAEPAVPGWSFPVDDLYL